MTEKKTPVFNWENGEFETAQGRVLTATEGDAVAQIVIKAQATARGVYMIYANLDTPDLHHKYGSDAQALITQSELSDDVRKSELERAVREAIIYDPWITDVRDVTLYQETDDDGKVMNYIDFSISTIYDKDIKVKGVGING